MDSREIGRIGEDMAAEHLLDIGHSILCRNYQIRSGEIDIISEHDEYIVFTEVKTRFRVFNERPAEAVDMKKREKIRKTAEYYYNFKTDLDKQPRFDIIEIVREKGSYNLIHIENAF